MSSFRNILCFKKRYKLFSFLASFFFVPFAGILCNETTWKEALGNCKLHEDILHLPKSGSDLRILSHKMREAEITSLWIGVNVSWKLKWLNGSFYGTVLIVIINSILI